MYGGYKKYIHKFYRRTSKRRDLAGDMGIESWKILKWISEKSDEKKC
jgi:hypothetical protein